MCDEAAKLAADFPRAGDVLRGLWVERGTFELRRAALGPQNNGAGERHGAAVKALREAVALPGGDGDVDALQAYGAALLESEGPPAAALAMLRAAVEGPVRKKLARDASSAAPPPSPSRRRRKAPPAAPLSEANLLHATPQALALFALGFKLRGDAHRADGALRHACAAAMDGAGLLAGGAKKATAASARFGVRVTLDLAEYLLRLALPRCARAALDWADALELEAQALGEETFEPFPAEGDPKAPDAVAKLCRQPFFVRVQRYVRCCCRAVVAAAATTVPPPRLLLLHSTTTTVH